MFFEFQIRIIYLLFATLHRVHFSDSWRTGGVLQPLTGGVGPFNLSMHRFGYLQSNTFKQLIWVVLLSDKMPTRHSFVLFLFSVFDITGSSLVSLMHFVSFLLKGRCLCK